MPKSLKSVPILIPGAINPITLDRLRPIFDVSYIEAGFSAVPAELARQVRGIAAIIPMDAATIDLFPNLEIIAHFGVGYDSVDAVHAASRGIVVTNTPGVLNEDVADLAVGLLINAIRQLPQAEQWLRAGHWADKGPYPLTRLTLRERRVGIYGLGRVGQAVARRLEGFGVEIRYHNRNPVEGVSYQYHASLLELAEAVDTIISVAPSTPETAKSVNAAVLTALGQNGVFVNIGRGATVDQDALILALQRGTIAAAGLDVYANEPNVPKALLDLANVSLAPHVGSATEYTRAAMATLCADNVIAWFSEGWPRTPVAETTNIRRQTATDASP
ncbi:2-hydroxyacid dehydrogenase [Martelella soudanensis]|uniref:2-hydroxyacid dehydrogenase n=1 Tax=unclassified Martelella TaxID=2629616 RepID=UPI0015E02447|nr:MULTISPECIES: 2-hydroxyacid dehydrogenase [unclassified Martelella]